LRPIFKEREVEEREDRFSREVEENHLEGHLKANTSFKTWWGTVQRKLGWKAGKTNNSDNCILNILTLSTEESAQRGLLECLPL
jgi:hypothetical protein